MSIEEVRLKMHQIWVCSLIGQILVDQVVLQSSRFNLWWKKRKIRPVV